MGRCEFEEAPREENDHGDDGENGVDCGAAAKDGESESRGMLEMSAAEYTIEGLRKETRRGGRRWTEYEREFNRL
jgi:hypothetical protein